MPHLQGKGDQQHACIKCKEDCASWDGMFCDDCSNWSHVKCDQLEIHHQEAFKELPEAPYICRDCRSDEKGAFSYAKSLERLHKGAKQGTDKLVLYVEREKHFMEDLTYNSTRSPKYSSDVQAQALLREYCPSEKKSAAKVTKDGNSLFSAVSLALVGNEKLATELRVRCCIEMVVYEIFYRWQENHENLSRCAPDYTESCLNCATPGEDSCVWTMSALASVVRRCIESIYPAVNGKMDRAVGILNSVFTPRNKVDEGESLKIFWGSSKKDQTPGSWVPDAFVPLVEMPTVPLSPVVFSPYLTPSRVSGRVRKPTAKVLAIATPKIKNEMKVVVESTVTYSDDGDADFRMPSDFTLEPADDEAFLEKYKPDKIDLHWMDKYSHAAEGGKPLKGTAFLPAQEVFNELSTTTVVCPSIPAGKKEDVYFVVDNSKNVHYKYRRNYFQDDCGRYNQRSGTTCKSFYLLSPNNILQQLIKDKGKYCKESKRVPATGSDSPRGGKGRPPSRNRGRGRGAVAERKVTKWIPLDPQPGEEEIVVLHRYYSSLDVDPTYKRRISWFSNLPDRLLAGNMSFLVEYITKPVPGLVLPSTRKGGLSVSSTPTLADSHIDAEMIDESEIADQATDADTSSQAEDTEMMDQSTNANTGEEDKNPKDCEEMESQVTEVEVGQVKEETGTQLSEEMHATNVEETEISESSETCVAATVVRENGSQT